MLHRITALIDQLAGRVHDWSGADSLYALAAICVVYIFVVWVRIDAGG